MNRHDKHRPLLPPDLTHARLTERISNLVLRDPSPRSWFMALLVCGLLALMFIGALGYMFEVGIGLFGVNIPVAWGFPITNTIWWIGIAHAGTLISAVLLITRQPWRASINRFAEAMAMFAVVLAGSYPIIHLGRPWFFYYLLPYPNDMELWPQWRSPLVWDFFAIFTYLTFTATFMYMSLLPDLATLRDRASSWFGRVFYGTLAIGWRGSATHWARYEKANMILSSVAAPIVVAVTGIISLDLAVSIVPGYHFTIFPPYFVAGALFSGFSTVALLAVVLRSMFGLQDLVTRTHLDYLGRMMLVFALVVDYAYTQEMFFAWYSGEDYYRYVYIDRWTGPYAPAWWSMIFCNVVLVQLLWFRRVRRSPIAMLCLAITSDIGMWLERFQIVFTSTHADYMPSAWGEAWPTLWDWAVYIGSLGVFGVLLLVFVRIMPLISLHDMRGLIAKRNKGGDDG
ncbi:quinol:cytochrome c oxidoreductase quinone-binding subunit 1 [Modicisalibacter xianhensis]|uniref:Quinol:cytochrome c oxidoreductase quinone-binding subunit 1 n=1 Tax=Modicisalibacter xianhensis TaxID=442341 RepID=A0A4V3GUV4_9GAMM|nr:NrfD/PsrC family molybdoenzyme membrane anchor subunit [Halomonas xianhensis]TDX32314.1 quinol:cytochrome c oxidoreductase quinone-binding subunit 1 [Halomonas xianhensis]